ncbi:MAG: cache domain-containing protein [Phycisphaerae bacterium]|nr:cache domain-containing protein [Phycisphaerae bacterium]
MKIIEHADHTEKLYGLRAEDIHKWIDGFFDAQSFSQFLRAGQTPDYDPYEHRKYRHCVEALEEAYQEFQGKYTRQQIKDVVECHIRDDYDGYLPSRTDFTNGTFKEKYHESDDHARSDAILSEMELSDYFKGKFYAHKSKQNRKKVSTFYWRIVLPTLVALALFVTSIFTIEIPVFRHNMMDREKEMIKELTQAAASIVERYIAQEKAGTLTRQEAQAQAIEQISQMRYGNEMKDYYWITDMHPRMVMHPYLPELTGKDLSNYKESKDRSGKKLFVEFVNMAKKDGYGYLEYNWQWKDDSTQVVPKLSYVRHIDDWDWIIGTGVYIHDVDEQISHLKNNLLWVFLSISLGLFGVMLYVILQSQKIEDNRLKAEAGLLEAKERYRALVEASNEGYILMVAGQNVYSNHTIQRMTGYSDQELAAPEVWKQLLPVNDLNRNGISQIDSLIGDTQAAAEFEAQLQTKSGVLLDVVMTASRIFFSQKNGHVISIRKISNKNIGLEAESYQQIRSYKELPAAILMEIQASDSVGRVVHTLNRLPLLVREMTVHCARVDAIRDAVGNIFDATMLRLMEMTLEEVGPAPVSFAFLTLGSNARHEMTMFSDQDNALIFADVPSDDIDNIRRYFLKLADGICDKLDKAGYPFCPGGVMAVNPRWCLTISEWKKRFTSQTISGSAEAILDINTFFDIQCAYGDQALVDQLQSHMIEITRENPEFFLHFARNCLSYQVPIGLFGQIRSEKQDGVRTMNLKDSIVMIVNFARIYALKNGLTIPATLARLDTLRQKGVLQEQTVNELTFAFDYLWYLRFYNQIVCHAELKRVNDELALTQLSEPQQQCLREVLDNISVLQNKLSYDFLGIANS